MGTCDITSDYESFAMPLSDSEFNELFVKSKMGDQKAADKIVRHNFRLINFIIYKKFGTVIYDKEELFSIGSLGLIKAINTFDLTKGKKFSTYASRCIENEILMYLRKMKKKYIVDSLDSDLYDEEGTSLLDILSNDTDLYEEYTKNELILAIRNLVDKLPNREKDFIIMYFGFNGCRRYSQKEIAEKYNLSQSYLSRKLNKIISQLGSELSKQGFIELPLNKIRVEDTNHQKRIKSIYEYFPSYSKEEINAMLKKLTVDEMKLIFLRYGYDLENPIISTVWSKEERRRFYNVLVPRMKRLLANPDGFKKKKVSRKMIIKYRNEILDDKDFKMYDVESIIRKVTVFVNYFLEFINQIDTDNDLGDFQNFRNFNFLEILEDLSPLESVVILLKFGYINNTSFSNNQIAFMLGIDSLKIIEILKSIFIKYKEQFFYLIDDSYKLILEK